MKKIMTVFMAAFVMAFVLAVFSFAFIVIKSDYDSGIRFACLDVQVKYECPQKSAWERAASWFKAKGVL